MTKDAEEKMTDVDEDSPDIPTKKILDLDSPLENHIITTKDDVTYINMDPVPLSMLEVIDGSDSTTTASSASLQPKSGANTGCDEGNMLGVEPWTSQVANLTNGVQLHTCPLCGESYSTYDELKDHLAIHSMENPFANKFFNTALYDGNGYIQAIKNFRVIEEKTEHICGVCSRSFTQSCNLKRHMKMHSGEKPFNCSECGKSYSEVSYLKRHILTHAGNNQNNFCSICNSKFNDIVSLRQHMQMHAANVKPHSCIICGKLYTRLAVLKRHLMLHFDSSQVNKLVDVNNDVNDDEEDYDDEEEEEDSEKLKSKKHNRPAPAKSHVCSTCSKAFNSLGNLQRHYRIHTGEKPYVCSICNSCFSQLSHLKQHHQTHTDEKFECPICSVCISNERNFKRHMKLHTGERPFRCETCSATFTQQSHLKKHRKTHNNTTYTCSNCNESLPDLNEYKEHMKKHAGEKPYACSVCDVSFPEIDQLKDHVETHSSSTKRQTLQSFNDSSVKTNGSYITEKSVRDCGTMIDDEILVNDAPHSHKNSIIQLKDNDLERHKNSNSSCAISDIKISDSTVSKSADSSSLPNESIKDNKCRSYNHLGDHNSLQSEEKC